MNRNLGIAAVALGSLALLAGGPLRGSRVSVDPKEMAFRIQKELDHVDPEELAGRISSEKKDFRLIDLRSEQDFRLYHIPGAERMDLPSLTEASFDPKETIILYSEGGVHSAQAMFLLWTRGFDHVFMLKGGIAAWEADVLHKTSRPHQPDSTASKPPPKPIEREEENFRREC